MKDVLDKELERLHDLVKFDKLTDTQRAAILGTILELVEQLVPPKITCEDTTARAYICENPLPPGAVQFGTVDSKFFVRQDSNNLPKYTEVKERESTGYFQPLYDENSPKLR